MRFIQATQEMLSKIPQIEDITDNLPKHKKNVWKVRRGEDVNEIIVHHMASDAPLENQAKYHVNHHEWAGLGYHIVISGGKIYQTNNLLHETAHCKGHNHHTIGICIHGDLTKRSMTDLERELLAGAIIVVKRLFKIRDIKGHNEYVKTSCPATSVARIKEDVTAFELDIERLKSPAKQEELAYRMANQILYLQRMSQHGVDSAGNIVNEGQRKWALAELMKMEPKFRELGWLK